MIFFSTCHIYISRPFTYSLFLYVNLSSFLAFSFSFLDFLFSFFPLCVYFFNLSFPFLSFSSYTISSFSHLPIFHFHNFSSSFRPLLFIFFRLSYFSFPNIPFLYSFTFPRFQLLIFHLQISFPLHFHPMHLFNLSIFSTKLSFSLFYVFQLLMVDFEASLLLFPSVPLILSHTCIFFPFSLHIFLL